MKFLLAIVPMLISLQASGQTTHPRPAITASSTRDVGPSAIWLPGPGFASNAYAVCNRIASSISFNYADCEIDQMVAAGAPPAAVKFAREFTRQYLGEVVVMREFKNIGSADLVSVQYPFRMGMNTRQILINYDPESPDVHDPDNVEKREMERDPLYRELKKRYPRLCLMRGQGERNSWLNVETQKDGTFRHTRGYLVGDGVRDNSFIAGATFEWDFDATGKFLGTKFLSFNLLPD
jgi:hypothetical protein